MENPGDLIRRARANRQRRAIYIAPPQAAENAPRPPQPPLRRGSYTALMRSHDRVHTRHLGGQGQ